MARLDDLRRLGLAWNDAWNSRDPAQLTRFFAPDSTFFEPTMPGPASGAGGIAASAARTWSDWPDAVFELVSITVEGARVVVEWRTSATHKTGLEHLLEGVDILEFDQDLVVACRSYYDTRTRKGNHGRR
jgi:ketosteroid isomerase-like protein